MSWMRFLLGAGALCASLWVMADARVDLNTADAETLSEGLNGIGPAKARAIVEHRETNGPFESVDDLVLVKGIGAATVDRIRDQAEVDD